MESLIVGSLISFTSIYLFKINQKKFETKNSNLENIKKNLVIVNSLQDVKNLADNTPIFISSKYNCKKEIWDNNLNIYFEYPVIKRKVIMYQKKEKEQNIQKTSESNNKNSKEKEKEKVQFVWSEDFQKGQDNPHFPFTSKFFFNDKLSLGPFEFDNNFISKYIEVNKKYILANKQCDEIPVPWIFSNLITNPNPQKGNHYNSMHSFWEGKFKIVADGELGIIAGRMNKNLVGDVKITYYCPSSEELTILGAKNGNTLSEINNGDSKLFYAKNKRVPLKQVMNDLERNNHNYYLGFNILIGILMLSGVGLGLNGVHQLKSMKSRKD
jgi:hypothetical protein